MRASTGRPKSVLKFLLLPDSGDGDVHHCIFTALSQGAVDPKPIPHAEFWESLTEIETPRLMPKTSNPQPLHPKTRDTEPFLQQAALR